VTTAAIRRNRRNIIRRSWKEQLFDAGNIIFMLLMSAAMLYPFWYVLIFSLNEGRDAAMGGIWLWPRKFTTSNYMYVLQNPMVNTAYLVTILRTLIGPCIHLIVTATAAYSLGKRDLPGRKWFIYFYMIPMFIGGTLISNYFLFVKLGLLNNFLVYVLPGSFSFFMMVIIRTFFEQLPESLEESALIDGAGYTRIFFKIVLPLSGPIVATTLFFSAVGHWLDFFTCLIYITKKDLRVVQYILYQIVINNETAEMLSQLSTTVDKELIGKQQSIITTQVLKMTTLVVVTFPLLFVYPFFQKYFVKGMLVGAIKA